MLKVVFVDVGGTLWPNGWQSLPGDDQERAARLRRLAPSLAEREASALVAALCRLDHPPTQRQETERLIQGVVTQVAPHAAIAAPDVIAAMCLPAPGRAVPFPGVGDLLSSLAGRGIRVVVVSNTLWRGDQAQRRDFADLGLAEHIADYVTSLDVGWRKPHPAFFAAALAAGRHPPSECALVGDSEPNDIEPAHGLGMFTIRVAIEEPPPATSAADHVSTSIPEVAGLLLDPAVGSTTAGG